LSFQEAAWQISSGGTIFRARLTTMAKRYDLRVEDDGKWTVFDIFTGFPAIIDAIEVIGFEADQAADLLEMLNAADVERRRDAGML
jgi:hypothetical protein